MTYPDDYPAHEDHGEHRPFLLTSEQGQWLTRNLRNLMDVLDKGAAPEMRGSWFEAELIAWMVTNFLKDVLPHDEGELTDLLGLWQEGRIAGRNGPAAVRVVGDWTALAERAYDVSYADSYERPTGARKRRSEMQRTYRERRAERLRADPSLAPHGSASTYSNWGCRCVECVRAQSVKNRSQRKERMKRRAESVAS